MFSDIDSLVQMGYVASEVYLKTGCQPQLSFLLFLLEMFVPKMFHQFGKIIYCLPIIFVRKIKRWKRKFYLQTCKKNSTILLDAYNSVFHVMYSITLLLIKMIYQARHFLFFQVPRQLRGWWFTRFQWLIMDSSKY